MLVGIWDCLTSQQVVDIVRHQVSEGKTLSEISELLFDHCSSPDTSQRYVGQDCMGILLVALLCNRTKEEWDTWVTDRVKQGYGYKTPSALPPVLHSEGRLQSFNAKELLEASERIKREIAGREVEGDKPEEALPRDN